MIKKFAFIFIFIVTLIMSFNFVFAGSAEKHFAIIDSNSSGDISRFSLYRIDNMNYVRLRDLAKALNDDDLKFNVKWDKNEGCVIINTKTQYENAQSESFFTGGSNNPNDSQYKMMMVSINGKIKGFDRFLIEGESYIRLDTFAENIGAEVSSYNNDNIYYIKMQKKNIEANDLSDEPVEKLSDIFDGDYINFISQKCYQEVEKDNQNGLINNQEFIKMIEPKEENFQNFEMWQNLFYLKFSTKEITNNTVLTYSVPISYNEMKPYIKKDLKPSLVFKVENASASNLHNEIETKVNEELNETQVTSESISETSTQVVTEVTNETTTEVTTDFVDPTKPMIALTFDDGPRAGSTDLILKALRENNGHATFFVVGNRVEANKDLIKQMNEQGCQIGNHTYSHSKLTGLNLDAMKSEIFKTSNLVYDAAGVYPFVARPPYGAINQTVKSVANINWFNWNVDTLDWKYRDEDYVYNYVLNNVKNGDVVLMHDLHETTARAMVRAIPKLREKGFQLVTLDEMAKAKGGASNVNGYIK